MTSLREAATTSAHADLPHRTTARWTSARKAQVVRALEQERLTMGDACDLYALSVEEIVSWQRAFERAGIQALRITHLQRYRRTWHRGDMAESVAGIGSHAWEP